MILKTKILTGICLSFVAIIKGQDISIANDRMNIFYVGVDNPISFAATGIPKSSLIIKSSIGSIHKDFSHYIFRSDSVGAAHIILYQKIKGNLKEIGRETFRVKRIPDPIAKVGASHGGQISAAALRAQRFLGAFIEDFDIDVHIPIDSFTVCIIRGDPCYYRELQNRGAKFSDEVITALTDIKSGDTVIFRKVFGKNGYGEEKEFNSITFFCY